MPVADRATARAEIYDLLNTAWLASAYATTPILWEGKKGTVPTDASGAVNAPNWVRVSLRHNPDQSGGTQAAAGADADGTRIYEREGIVFVQIFTTPGKGLRLADDLATIAQRAFQGKQTAGGIWFRHARAVEIGESGDWFQTNVVVEFNYQEVR